MATQIVQPAAALPPNGAPKYTAAADNTQVVEDLSVLIQVRSGSFGNTRQVSASKVEVDADKDQLRISKNLLDSPELKKVRSIDSEIRQYLYNRCLPSVFRAGVYRLPYQLIEEVDSKLQDFAIARQKAVDDAAVAYPQRCEEAAKALRAVYNQRDYPSVDRFRSSFYLEWSYFETAAPGKLAAISKDIYEREREKAEGELRESVATIRGYLRESFADMVSHMVERLTGAAANGSPKVFKQSTIDNLGEFLDYFDKRNLTNDTQMADLVGKARALMNGVDAKTLRDDFATRKFIRDGFSQIQDNLDVMLTDKPKRRIRFEEGAA